MRAEVFHKVLEKCANQLPIEGGWRMKARYIPHTGELQMERVQLDRQKILQENKVLYEQNAAKRRSRNDMAGGYPMRIPVYDLTMIDRTYPELKNAPGEVQAKFYRELYKRVKEYRIG